MTMRRQLSALFVLAFISSCTRPTLEAVDVIGVKTAAALNGLGTCGASLSGHTNLQYSFLLFTLRGAHPSWFSQFRLMPFNALSLRTTADIHASGALFEGADAKEYREMLARANFTTGVDVPLGAVCCPLLFAKENSSGRYVGSAYPRNDESVRIYVEYRGWPSETQISRNAFALSRLQQLCEHPQLAASNQSLNPDNNGR